jgi:hypothetical protein
MGTRAVILSGCLVALAAASRSEPPQRLPPGDYEPRRDAERSLAPEAERERREDALRRMKVWRAPAVPIARARLDANPKDAARLLTAGTLACRFLPAAIHGTTPKFDCVVAGGEVVKVKYGANPELRAELAASRLLSALGFGADRMYRVPTVRCFGCPRSPFRTLQVVDLARLGRVYRSTMLDYGEFTDFADVAVERRFPGTKIEAPGHEGWAWFELEKVASARGGATRAELDALRLMAVFLAHWDNKDENQRLVCLPGGSGRGAACAKPFGLLHDVGASFGPHKADLDGWRRTPIWREPSRCRISMTRLPYGGGTFLDAEVSEAGRRFLLGLLRQLSRRQVRDLFSGAGFGPEAGPGGSDVSGWVEAFENKVREIESVGRCPRD